MSQKAPAGWMQGWLSLCIQPVGTLWNIVHSAMDMGGWMASSCSKGPHRPSKLSPSWTPWCGWGFHMRVCGIFYPSTWHLDTFVSWDSQWEVTTQPYNCSSLSNVFLLLLLETLFSLVIYFCVLCVYYRCSFRWIKSHHRMQPNLKFSTKHVGTHGRHVHANLSTLILRCSSVIGGICLRDLLILVIHVMG